MISFLRSLFADGSATAAAASGQQSPATASGEMIAFPIVVNPSPDERNALAVARLGHIERFIRECQDAGVVMAEDKLEHFRHEVAHLTGQLGMAALKKD